MEMIEFQHIFAKQVKVTEPAVYVKGNIIKRISNTEIVFARWFLV